MKQTEIKVYHLAQTTIVDGLFDWLESHDAADIQLTDNPVELLVGLAGKRCYKSFKVGLNPNVTKIREDWTKYLDNVLASGHGSVLEHVTFTFGVENVSRVFTAEMNRHRAGVAISEASMRYIRYDDIPYWVPFSIRPTDCPLTTERIEELKSKESLSEEDMDSLCELNMWEILEEKKAYTRKVFLKAFDHAELMYKLLMDAWKDELAPESKFAAKKEITSMMRRIIPMGVSTGGLWTMNLRALRHIMALRCNPAAEEEIAYVFGLIGKHMVESVPALFGDFEDQGGFLVPKYPKV